MILIDYREERPGTRRKRDLADVIRRLGVTVDVADLPFGDVAFEGIGLGHASISVGVELKRLHDMLNCIDDSRFSGHQRVGMRQLYDESYLLLEGVWRAHDPKGLLMESRDGSQWFECRPASRPVMYAKLRRYLFSISRSGITVLYTRDLFQTAYDVVELYRYYQKREHTSMLEKHQLNVPALTRKPPLIRRWAAEIEGVGVQKLDAVEHQFKTPVRLATGEEMEWLCIPGVGAKTARDIMAEIEGRANGRA